MEENAARVDQSSPHHNSVATPLNEAGARPSRLRVVESTVRDVYLNLSIEQQLYDDLGSDEVVLFLWRNDPCVVLGRHQNPWRECDLDGMAAAGVQLARRASGGGAVYHDAGNGNFTFLADAALYHQELHFAVVIAALVEYGIMAHRSGRNDIMIGDRKISGNAFRHRKDKSYHHGTLLVSTDLDRLTRFLNPGQTAVTRSSGIESVRSRVVNLSELCPGIRWTDVIPSLVRCAERAYDMSAEVTRIDGEEELAAPALSRRRTMYRDWRWIYGRTPDFTRLHRLSDAVALEVTVKRGVIVEPAWLGGLRYRPEDLLERAGRGPADEAALCSALAAQLAATAGLPISEEPID